MAGYNMMLAKFGQHNGGTIALYPEETIIKQFKILNSLMLSGHLAPKSVELLYLNR
jgi:hypothetical protein